MYTPSQLALERKEGVHSFCLNAIEDIAIFGTGPTRELECPLRVQVRKCYCHKVERKVSAQLEDVRPADHFVHGLTQLF